MPLKVTGARSEHVVAFAREHQGQTAIIAVPRLCASLLGETVDTVCDEALWADTSIELPGGDSACYHNVFTGECLPTSEGKKLRVAQLFLHFAVALLISERPGTNGDCASSARSS